MQQVTFYDSMYEENRALKPTTHMTCKLSLHDISRSLLIDRGILQEKTMLTPVVSVLDELPQISFTTTWQQSNATSYFTAAQKIFEPTDNLMSIGSLIQMFAGDNYVSTPLTNEFSQRAMTASSPLSITLKFRIYADSYNTRYRQMASTYETWLKTLFFATSPLVTSTFGNYVSNIKTAVGHGIDKGIDLINTAVDSAGVFASLLTDVAAGPQNFTSATSQNYNTLTTNIKEMADKVSDIVTKNTAFGHVVFDIEIPKFIQSTKNAASKVYWYINTFNATPSAQFVRGLYGKDTELFRPKPLYYDFTVTLNTAQDLTREQMISLFVPKNMINRKKTKA
jgi:hypothetical protein